MFIVGAINKIRALKSFTKRFFRLLFQPAIGSLMDESLSSVMNPHVSDVNLFFKVGKEGPSLFVGMVSRVSLAVSC